MVLFRLKARYFPLVGKVPKGTPRGCGPLEPQRGFNIIASLWGGALTGDVSGGFAAG